MNRRFEKTELFIGLTFFASWLMAAAFFVLGGRWNTSASLAMAVIYMFLPMIATIVIQKFVYKEPLKEPLGISFRANRWYLAAWLLPPAIASATMGVSLLFPGVKYTPDMAGMFERLRPTLAKEQIEQMKIQALASPIHPFWMGLLQALIMGPTINAVAAFGEEVGWRGLLQREFGYMGFWKSSAIIGVIWGLWHAPLILQGHNYPQHPVAGVGMMIIWTLLLSPIFSYVRLKARSVIAAAIIHGTLNASYGLAIMVISGGDDLTVGLTGAAGFIALGIINLCLFAYENFLAGESINLLIAENMQASPSER